MKGLLLAGGHGTRLRPLTFTGNKHMIPIANRPILRYGIDNLRAAGVRDVGIILGPIHEGIREVLGDGSALGINIEYIHQGPPKGLAHAVLCARDFLGDDPFVMYLGDNLLQGGVTPFVRAFERSKADAIIGATPVAEPRHYGVIELEGDRVASLEEKPANPRSNLALVGVYLFTSVIFPVIDRLAPSKRGELEITDAIWNLIHGGKRVVVERVRGWWKDTGLPSDLIEANDLVLSTRPPSEFRIAGIVEEGARVSGPVDLGAHSRLDAEAIVTGPVVIGEGVHIGAGTTLGPGTAVGDGAVLAGCSVRRSILMERTRIEGPVRLANSILGRDVVVSARADPAEESEIIVGDAARIRL